MWRRFAIMAGIALALAGSGNRGAAQGAEHVGELAYATSAHSPGNPSLVVHPVGGESRPLRQRSFVPSLVAWIPGGKRIVFSNAEGDIWEAAPDEQTARRLLRGFAGALEALEVSPDGRRIAFIADGSLWIVGRRGGGRRKLARSVDVLSIEWSPDSRRLAVGGFAGLFVVPLTGELRRVSRRPTPRELEIEAGAFEPRWSPNGKRIAFFYGLGGTGIEHIHVVDVTGRNQRRLARGGEPAWSPDGRRIAFVGTDENGEPTKGVYVVSSTGGPKRLLADVAGAETLPVWTADGRGVAFIVNRGNRLSVRRVLTAPRRVTPLPRGTRVVAGGSWAGDGRSFVHVPEVNNTLAQLALVRAGGPTRWFRPSPDRESVWTADGRRVAIVRGMHEAGYFLAATHVLVATRDGRVTADLGVGEDPTWSRDGTRLAFTRGGAVHVWEGGRTRRVGAGAAPTWAPDGRRLAWGGSEITILDLRGGVTRRITPRFPEYAGTPSGYLDVRWSPAREELAALVLESEFKFTVGVVGLREPGTLRAPFAALGVPKDGPPSWSPNGDRLAADAGSRGIAVASRLGVGARLLPATQTDVGLGRPVPAWSSDGRLLAYVQDGVRVVSTVGPARVRIVTADANAGAPSWRPPLRSR